jgi:hypothetical protein
VTAAVARATRGRAASAGALGRATRGRYDLASASVSAGASAPGETQIRARVRGSAIVDIPDRLQWNLTPECLATVGLDPVIPGEFISYRHQAVDITGTAISLEGAKLVMTLYKLDSLAVADRIFRRRSLDVIAGWTPATYQLAADTDQVGEDVNVGTGKGWWAMTWAPTDEALLISSVGSWWYDVRALFVDSKVRTLLRGRIAIPWPRSVVADFTP